MVTDGVIDHGNDKQNEYIKSAIKSSLHSDIDKEFEKDPGQDQDQDLNQDHDKDQEHDPDPETCKTTDGRTSLQTDEIAVHKKHPKIPSHLLDYPQQSQSLRKPDS